MLTKPIIEKQINRLSQLDGFPKQQEAVDELIAVLQTAPSVNAAHNFVTSWLHEEQKAPMPAAIYRYFHPPAQQKPGVSRPGSRGCPDCEGIGWVIVAGPNKTTGAYKCKCGAA